ncbi:MAG: NlpC/P60 family protein [Clostridium sp.]|uniref:glucosaminidase domain-containing protein n=1 Tax=Clostridium sp. TaxID=1506 RepID=UPI0028FFCE2E|nr:glucosaminidase domain-containing protein [Clostridium sp.]MDU1603501.1 NlpC/P60 family protein [Clostridium sp.]
MNNIDLRVQKWNDYNNIIPIQDVCTSIKMNCSLKNITTELQFTIGYEYNDYYYFNYEIGDNIYLYINGKLMFCGKITDSTFNLSENSSTFICYDLAWWVVKNNITYNFNREMSVKDALIRVFGAFDFFEYDNIDTYELGKYADMKISKHRIKNKPAKDVLMAIMSDITRVNGIYYYIHMTTTGRIAISECDKYYSGLTIQKSSSNVVDGNLINYTVNRSMQNVVNQYRVYDSNCKEVLEKPLRPVGFDDNDKKRYGIIQDTVILDKDEDLETAIKEAEKEDADELTWNDQTKIVNNYNSKILKIKNQLEVKGYPETEVTVKCIGDINYKVGYGVMCKLPDSEFYDKFMYITASEFEFIPNSDYWINTLTLSTSKKQELTLWEDIEEVVTDENGNIIQGGSILGSSTVVKKALEWAYQTANDDSVGYSMNPNLRNGPDYYDCSAFVIHAYRAGGLSLSNSTYTGDMYAPFLAEGFDDVTSEVNLSTGEGMIAGDVLLNTISHTEIYTGNGKMIGAHTDRYAKADQVSEKAYNNHPWNYVLRYAITEEKGDSESVSSDGSLDDVVNCTSQSEFASMVASYAKELYSKYHIFPGTIISCMIQESWTGSGFTKLAKNHYNFGGVKCSASSENAVQDYKPPSSEGSMLYRKFDSVKDFMIYWCELISGGSYNYKSAIADKNTPKEQIFGFDSTPYAGDKTKGSKMWAIYSQNNLSQYDNI